MKIIFHLFIFTILISSCSSGSEKNKNNLKTSHFYHYTYNIDNDNPVHMGFYYSVETAEEGAGIKSISASDSFVFLLDGYYQNVKKIKIATGELKVSDTFSEDILLDMILYKNFIYIVGMYEGIYVLDNNLKLLSTIKLPEYTNSEKYFYLKEGNLMVYIPHLSVSIEILEDSSIGKLLKDSHVDIIGEGILRNDKFTYNKDSMIITFKYGEIKLYSLYVSTFKYYNSFNIFYSEKLLTYFTIDIENKNIELNIYEINN